MKDKQLDLLLSEYRAKEVSPDQVKKWQQVLQNEMQPAPLRFRFNGAQLTAAALIGFLIGALLVTAYKRSQDPWSGLAQNYSDNATIEFVMTKTN